MKTAILPAIVVLMIATPAFAANLAIGSLAPAPAAKSIDCSIAPLSLRTDSPLLVSHRLGDEAVQDSAAVDNRWAEGASSHWNAGMNRAVDHLLTPPQNVKVFATQTGGGLRTNYEGSNGPNNTFAGFEIVIH